MGRIFIWLWAIISAILALEFFLLHRNPDHSILFYLQSHHWIKQTIEVSPLPGRPLSLVLGYVGFGLMLLTNLYIMRKRFSFMGNLGVLRNWLDFHIFCGLTGPIMILFHSDFKVRGLVAISFWSMWVSFSSGVVGRYFYVQISKVKGDYSRDAEVFLSQIKSFLAQRKLNLPEQELNFYRNKALAAAGADQIPSDPFSAMFSSMFADVKLLMFSIPSPAVMGEVGRSLFLGYAVNVRKANTVESFNRLMGYWHTFHTPFAVFMYIAAVLHIMAEFYLGAA